VFHSTFAPVPQNDHIEIRNESRSQPLERCNAKSTSRLICIILFVFGERFGKAQRAERCGASVKRCNAAKRRQNQTLRAGTVFRPTASGPLTVAPLRSAGLSLYDRRLSPAKWCRLNATCSRPTKGATLCLRLIPQRS